MKRYGGRFFDILLNAVLVTGPVIVMMMLIECFNVLSKGRLVSLGSLVAMIPRQALFIFLCLQE